MAVIDELIIKENGESKIVDSADNITIDIINGSYINNIDYHFAKNTENIGGYCDNAVEEPIIDLKISGNSIQGKLPSEYQQIEYIETSGEQYINSNFYPDSNTSIEMDVLVKTATRSKNNFAFGVNSDSANTKRFILNLFFDGAKNLGVYPRFSINAPASSVKTIEFEKWYNYRLDKGNYYVDNVLVASYKETFDKNEYPLYINAHNNVGAVNTNFIGNTKIKSCKIWDNTILVRNLIPCYHKSDNVVGMYDLVNNVFYTNQGTGEFIKGNDTPTPETPIEIESVGEKTKNLINYKDFILSGYTKEIENGIQFEITGKRIEIKVPFTFKAKTTYVISAECTEDGYFGGQLVNDFITNFWCDKTIKSFVVENLKDTDVTANIRCVDTTGTKGSTIKFAMLEISSSATDYEPYGYKVPVKVNGEVTNIFLDEPLRKVGDYADYIDYKNKKVVRNFKKVNLSILNWTVYSDNSFRCYLDNCKPSPINGLANILNSHYRLVKMNVWNNTKPNYTMALNDTTKPDLRIRNTDYENVEDFIQSLEGVYMIYELETPTEETINIPEISTSKGTNNFVVETTLLPSELKINYWKQI